MQTVPVSLLHPYYPTTIELPEYVPNSTSVSTNVAQFSLLWILVLGGSWIVLLRPSQHLSIYEKLTSLWFILCGTLHVFFEGYFVLNQSTLIGKQDLFAQLWKEYAISDSRYLTGDALVLGAEVITVLSWGPLSFAVATCIIRLSPWRHPLQIIVCVAHVYGDALYISTSLIDMSVRQISYSRPEALYFWFYFLFLNGIWLVIPSVLLYQSCYYATKAAAELQKGGQLSKNDVVAEKGVQAEQTKADNDRRSRTQS